MSAHEERGLLTPQALRLSDAIMRKATLGGGPDVWVAEVEARAIAAFTAHMSVEYRKHSADAVREDMIVACARFGVNPEWYYTDEDGTVDDSGARVLRADVAHYRILNGLD